MTKRKKTRAKGQSRRAASPHGDRATGRTLAAGIAAASLCAAPAVAHAQDLRFSVTPTAQQVSWNNSLGIDNSLLYGGRLGMVFGRRIELQGFYLTNQGSNTGIRDLYDRLGVDDPPQNPGLDVRNYGASVVYNFSVGGWTPFVRGGGSILRFDPSGGETSERIALSYGGGLRFGKPGGLRLNLFVDDLRFRVDRRLLLGLPRNGLPVDADVDANKLRSNLTYGAGLTVPFGGGAVTYDDTPQYQLGNVALPVDVFAGRFDFAGSSGLPEQYIVGARTGIDFGPLVGLRAFYWRGTNDNFNRTQGVQGYGGEAQFALNAGPGINPYLIAGAGQIDFTNSYNALSNGAAPTVIPADQTALILGGGAKIPLGARFTLNASARNWLTSRGGRTEDVVDASQLRSNWQYALGVSFGVGGRGNRRKVAEKPKNDTVFVDRESGERLARRDIDPKLERDGELIIERYVITADGDTLRGEDAEKALAKGGNLRVVTDTLRGVRADSALAFAGDRRRFDDRRDGRRDDEKSRDRRDRDERDRRDLERLRVRGDSAREGYASQRTAEVVVPTEGEIIIRYGPQQPAQAQEPLVIGVPAGQVMAGGMQPGMLQPGVAPQRPLLREYRDSRNRIVREFQEPNNLVVREYQDGNRLVREFRDPATNRMRREYRPLPATQPLPPMPMLQPGQVQGSYDGDVEMNRARVEKESTQVSPRAMQPQPPVNQQPAPQPAQQPAPTSPSLSSEDVRSIIRDELQRDAQARRASAPTTTVVTTPAPPATTTAITAQGDTLRIPTSTPGTVVSNRRLFAEPGVQGGVLYSGFTANDAGQLVLGGRIDLGSVSPNLLALRLVPELAFGFGNGGTSTYVAANAAYEFGELFRFRPRVAIGVGFLNFSNPVGSRDGLDLVATPSYGVSIPLAGLQRLGGPGTPELVIEHQGINFFNLNRFIVALGWRR